MKANEMFQDVLDRMESAVDDASRAKKDLEVANTKVRDLEYDLKQAQSRAECLLDTQRGVERRLEIALSFLTGDQRAAFDLAAKKRPTAELSPEEIPF